MGDSSFTFTQINNLILPRFYHQSVVICQSLGNLGLESYYSENTSVKMYTEYIRVHTIVKAYGEKPISFSFTENGEQFMIGSEVSPENSISGF